MGQTKLVLAAINHVGYGTSKQLCPALVFNKASVSMQKGLEQQVHRIKQSTCFAWSQMGRMLNQNS